LNVENGGAFSGKVTGTGQLNVKSGDFSIKGGTEIVSNDPLSSFVIGGSDSKAAATRVT